MGLTASFPFLFLIEEITDGIDFVHPSKLRFENKVSQTKCSSKLGHFVWDTLFIRDHDGI
jgi:hypothetical protein